MKHILSHKLMWTVLVIALQIASLAYIAINREWIRLNGEIVYLSTAPVDPRDIFRGDYVALNYNINRPDIELNSDIDETWLDQRFYATLEKDALGIASVTGLTLKKPTSGLFIKARSGNQYWSSWRKRPNLRYGIEKYFTEQGAGLELENQRGKRDEWQTSLEMQVALGTDGTAVIKGHRWAKVSTRLEVIEAGSADLNDSNNAVTEDNQRLNPLVKVSFRNNSNEVITLLDSSEHCAFNISQREQALNFANRDCSKPNWQNIRLEKDQVYEFTIDFEQAPWFVRDAEKTSQAHSLAEEGWGRFRLSYQPKVSHAQYHGHYLSSLKTAAFMVTGAVD